MRFGFGGPPGEEMSPMTTRASHRERAARTARGAGAPASERVGGARRGEAPRTNQMSDKPKSDALVFFGITGDLAHKKIFPALQSLVRRGKLNVPVVGVARSELSHEQLVERAKASIAEHGGVDPAAFPKLADLLRYVSGRLRRSGHLHPYQNRARTVPAPAALSGDPAEHVSRSRTAFGRAQHARRACCHRKALRPRFGDGTRSQQHASQGLSGRIESSASITTWARKPFRTSCISALPTRFSSRFGTGTTSKACRSRWPRISASRDAESSTKKPGWSAT